MHERAHEGADERRGDTITTRGMHVFSRTLGLRGVCDVVEFIRDESGIPVHGRDGTYRPVPVEYKRGRAREDNADALQLCAQAMCLEEMLVCDIPQGYLFYGEPRRRLPVIFDDALRLQVRTACTEMHALFARAYTPQVRQTKSCRSCSLADLCLPRLSRMQPVNDYITHRLGEVE